MGCSGISSQDSVDGNHSTVSESVSHLEFDPLEAEGVKPIIKEKQVVRSKIVGSVAGLWRFPVKSMSGEQIEEVELTETGLVGDRAYALIDKETNKVVSAKSVKLFPDMLGCRTAFLATPRSGHAPPPVRITLPNGTIVTTDSFEVDRLLSAYFGRDVKVASAAPDDFTIDQYHPNVEHLDPLGHRDTVVEQKLGSAFFANAGLDSPVPAGAFFDLFPVSVLTTSTLDRLSKLCPQSRFDSRRFRMNVIISSNGPGFLENEWIGCELAIGDLGVPG